MHFSGQAWSGSTPILLTVQFPRLKKNFSPTKEEYLCLEALPCSCLSTLPEPAQIEKHSFIGPSTIVLLNHGCAYSHALYLNFQREKSTASLLLAPACSWSTVSKHGRSYVGAFYKLGYSRFENKFQDI